MSQQEIVDALKDGPLSSRQIAQKAGIPLKIAQYFVTQARKQHRIKPSGKTDSNGERSRAILWEAVS